MKMPTISVVIPTYNAERTILETIESIQQQTFSGLEIIVINDGSTDKSLELLQSIKDDRIRIFSYQNGGLPVARNRGISRARGEFIAFIDADDLWTADKLELQLAALQKKPKAGVAYSWTYFKYEKEQYSYADEANHFEGNVYTDLLVKNFLHNGSNPLIRRKAIESVGLFDPTLKSAEDWDFYLRLAAKWEFALIPKTQIIYRQSSNSMSYKIDLMEEAAFIVIEKAYQSAPQELQYIKSKSISEIYRYGAQQDLRFETSSISKVKRAAQKLAAAIQLQPKILLEEYTIFLIKLIIKKTILLGLRFLSKANKNVYLP